MKYETSCGFIVYQESQGTNYYLIIRTTNGDYGFPKGHMEENETEYETAVRELKEETNLEVEIDDGFRWQIEYKLPYKENTTKKSIYFIGKSSTDNIVCQEQEVCEAKFLPLAEAINILTFDDTKKMLLAADNYIKSHEKTEHIMNLHPSPFYMIREGEKTIELRLYDKKRQMISVGDTIKFVNTQNTTEYIHTAVIKIFVFDSFNELYKKLPLLECGYTKSDVKNASSSDMELYYSKEKQKQFGVVGIKISIM